MNLKTNHYLLILITILAFTACKQPAEKTDNNQSILNKEDSMKIAFYDYYFNQNSSKSIESILDRRVNIDSAKASLVRFKDLSTNLNPAELRKMFTTESVSFKLSNLQPWLDSLRLYTNTNELRICFGIYSSKFLASVNKPTKDAGRLTIYLWPYNNSAPAQYDKMKQNDRDAEPYNIGELHP